MSEDFPQPNPDELQQQLGQDVEQAVAEDAARAGEITEPAEIEHAVDAADEAGEQAVAKHVDVQHVTDDDDIPGSVVQDKNKAEEMAYAGKVWRDGAARHREDAERNEQWGNLEAANNSRKIAERRDATAESLEADAAWKYDKTQWNNLVHDKDKAEKMAYAGKEERDYAALKREEIKRGEYGGDDNEEKKLRRAEEADRTADGIEKWTGILHDHPISEQYKESHPKIDFEPSALAQLEKDVTASLAEVERIGKLLSDAPASIGVDGINETSETMRELFAPFEWGKFRPGSVIKQAYGERGFSSEPINPTKLAEWERLHSDENTTLGQIKEMYIEAFKTAFVNRKVNFANSAGSVLDDIRSGRASA